MQGGTGCVARQVEEMSKIDDCDMEKFGTRYGTEKTFAILGDRWRPQTVKQEGGKIRKTFLCNIWKNVRSAQMLKVSLLRGGTVPPLERDV